MNLNRELAGATLAHLAALEVHHVIVCAGARNAPLVTSLLAMGDGSDWRIWNHFDERAASFFALGLAKKSQKPTAVITTSGTAVAEMLPATIEAYYSGIPLVLVTADRPPSYRGSGAPQAIEQPNIFGPYAPVAVDVQKVTDLSLVSKWARDEPLHLNVCFEEPSPSDTVESFDPADLPAYKAEPKNEERTSIESFTANSTGLLIILGELDPEWREPVEKYLSELGAPIWAEATSGLRESDRLSDLLIRQERQVAAFAPREVLRIGGVPSLRFWRDLEPCEEIAVLSVSRRPFSGLARSSHLLVSDHFPAPDEVIRQGQVSDPTLLSVPRFENCLLDHSGSEPAMMRALSELIPSDAMVFLGNSLPIREWNLAASCERAHPNCFASRGANGIDGQVATFLGLSETEEESWGIFGDLTALYDLNAPALLEQLPEARRRFVVINNGGGKIFSRLPSMGGLPDAQKKVTENHHEQSFAPWASLWCMEYVLWKAGDDVPVIEGDSVVVEVVPSAVETERFWASWK